MKTKALLLALAVGIFCGPITHARLAPPPICTNCTLLDAWYFPTNWLSQALYSPVGFSNIVSITNNCDGNGMLLDTTNTTPAFLFYNIVETNEDSSTFTNLTPQSGTLYAWLNPCWSSSNSGGAGPGDWANIISAGEFGTNGSSWWAWYISPSGNEVVFASSTNGDSPVVYLSAPISFLASNWYNLTLSYSPTNCALYTNGVLVTNGTGVEYWPGPDVTYFAIGSDSEGYHQIRSEISDVQSYNYQLDAGTIWDSFSMITICYGLGGDAGGGGGSSLLVGAPFTNISTPTFDAVTGPGFLVADSSAILPADSDIYLIWITNYSATAVSSNVVNLNFAIAGGSNNVPYDVFATAALLDPVTNSVWYWMGQAYRGTNYTLPITNNPGPGNAFIIVGTPLDSDNDGLTDAYELLVTHTSTNNPDTSGDGMLDGWKVMWGLNLHTNNLTIPSERANYDYDPASRWQQIFGVRVETNSFDGEGNILSVH